MTLIDEVREALKKAEHHIGLCSGSCNSAGALATLWEAISDLEQYGVVEGSGDWYGDTFEFEADPTVDDRTALLLVRKER